MGIIKHGIIKHGIPQGPTPGPLLFLLYINNLPKITDNKSTNDKSKVILFADDMSIIVTNNNPTDSIRDITMVCKNITNGLMLIYYH